jgi:hypothetical protein
MGVDAGPIEATENLMLHVDAGNTRSYSGTGLTLFDLRSSGIGATLVNGVSYNSGNLGYFSFDGSNDFMQVPVSYVPTGNEISICIWNYGTTAQTSSVFSSHTVDNARTINIHLPWNDSVVYWDCGYSAGTYDRVNTATLSASQWQGWHYWVFNKNATTGVMNIYLDSQLNVTGSSKTRTMTTPSEAYIGRFQISSPVYHIGRVGHISIYNRYLSAQEILNNYVATKRRYGL